MSPRENRVRLPSVSFGPARQGSAPRGSAPPGPHPSGATPPSSGTERGLVAERARRSERPVNRLGEAAGPPETVSPERVLDDLLAALSHHQLSPIEARVLLWLAEREATPSELKDALQQGPGAITRVARRLTMRGLIRRRFERGQRPGFVFGITPAGLLALRPFVQRIAETGPAGGNQLR
jgi:DNA-binding transcriptional ArsR family regulator